MAIRFQFALSAPTLTEQVYSYPWYLITEITCVGRMYVSYSRPSVFPSSCLSVYLSIYLSIYLYLLTWDLSYPLGAHGWEYSVQVCSMYVFMCLSPSCPCVILQVFYTGIGNWHLR